MQGTDLRKRKRPDEENSSCPGPEHPPGSLDVDIDGIEIEEEDSRTPLPVSLKVSCSDGCMLIDIFTQDVTVFSSRIALWFAVSNTLRSGNI
jgi:hypothetical protein